MGKHGAKPGGAGTVSRRRRRSGKPIPKLSNRLRERLMKEVRGAVGAQVRILPVQRMKSARWRLALSKLERATERFGIMAEFFEFLWRQKLWWMMPMFGLIFLFGLLLILGQSTALAPFIYTLF
jgi:Family of unknown function (DUF5989)